MMQQMALFNPDANTINGLRDSAFARNRELPVHRWVPWVAGFSAQFVDDCLSKYLAGNGKADRWVLDPFAGVGTTLVEAYTKGLNVVGFEINPYAALASKTKLRASAIQGVEVKGDKPTVPVVRCDASIVRNTGDTVQTGRTVSVLSSSVNTEMSR